MDPIAIATGVLAFAALISDIARLGRFLMDVPEALLQLQRDMKRTLTVISRTVSLVSRYQPTEKVRDLDIGAELTECCFSARKAAMKLLDDLRHVAAPPDHRFGSLRTRLQGIRHFSSFGDVDKEIRRHMEWFDRLRDTFHLQVSLDGKIADAENSQHAIPELVLLSQDDIEAGQETLTRLIHDRILRIKKVKSDENHNLDVIKVILADCGINPNFESTLVEDRRKTPLHLAAANGDTHLITLLMEHGARAVAMDQTGQTPIHVAEQKNDIFALKALLIDNPFYAETQTARADAKNAQGHTILWRYACGHSKSDRIFHLLLNLDTETVHTLVNCRHSDPELPTALWAAAARGCLKTAQALLHAGADPSVPLQNNKSTLLHRVTWPSMDQLYPDLLRHGADPSARDEMGREPLHCAATTGLLGICSTLLAQRSVNVDSVDHEQRTPLMCAAEAGHLKLVERFLFEHKADVGLRDVYGHDAFMAACLGGHATIAALLFRRPFLREGEWCEHGVDETNKKGSSALRVAAVLGHVEVVEFLVELGASTEGINPEDVGAKIVGGSDGTASRLRVNTIRKVLGMRPLESEVMMPLSRKSVLGPRCYTTA